MGAPFRLDADAIEDFLQNVLDRTVFHLTSINPLADKKSTYASRSLFTDDIGTALAWIEKQQDDGYGVYFHANIPKQGVRKKAKREGIGAADCFHLDCDPPDSVKTDADLASWQEATIEDLQTSDVVPRPTAIWISGYGVQAVWLLKKRRKMTDAVLQHIEDVNRRLAHHFGGDRSAFDVSRVLRLPGTVNYPNKKKLEAGREASPARLVENQGATYGLDNFDSLPAAPAAVSRTKNPARVDYTLYEYDPEYEPIAVEDLRRDRRDIWDQNAISMRELKGDRSAIAYGFIRSVATHIMDMLGCSAQDMQDDINVRKNIAEIVWTCELPFLSHYEEHANPGGTVGYDTNKILRDMADAGVTFSQAREAKAERRKVNAAAAAKPKDQLAPIEARRLFIEYVDNHSKAEMLPNTLDNSNGKNTAQRQLPTEANVRQVLQDTNIIMRWDIMRDEARVVILPGKRSTEAGFFFARALADSHAQDMAEAEQSLLMDGIAQVGITGRDDVRKLLTAIAKDNYFHPMADYCTSVAWDGKRRVRNLAKRLKTSNPLAGRYMEIFFRQGVAVVKSLERWRKTGEGEMLRSILVLNGPQEILKTTFLNMLVPPGMKSAGSKLALGSNVERDTIAQALSGVVCNLDEIEGTLLRSEHSALKNFVAERTDSYRLPYARTWVRKPRMTQLCGTANDLLLHDHTGSSRFLVITLSEIDFSPIADSELQQMYAEAWHDVMIDGETWWLTPDESKIRNEHNAEHQAETEEQVAVTAYFHSVGKRHTDAWLPARHVAKLLDVRYTPQRWAGVKIALEANGCVFRDRVRWKGRDYRRVWSFPVLAERLAEIEAGL